MKVYIIFEKDGFNGEQIEKVFLHESEAQDWVIDNCFGSDLYGAMMRHELEENALSYIESYEVIE